MFKFRKTKTAPPPQDSSPSVETAVELSPPQKPKGIFGALSRGLKRTRSHLTEGLANIFLGEKTLDDALLEEIETQLLISDISIDAAEKVIEEMTARVKRKEVASSTALFKALQEALETILRPCQTNWIIPNNIKPYVILLVGVNGAGKTTTIGKLAKRLQNEGKSVLLAAGDTFRAAAIEQLKVWGERNQIAVIAQHSGADSASVIYDALAAAKARNIDVVIADTAGRLHTQAHLMEELRKIKRVLSKLDGQAPHETMLVLDAGIGQNALKQAQQFDEAVKLTSLTITKLDGTAKGGMIFSLAEHLRLPIRYVGVGEAIEDLQPFDAHNFVEALLGTKD